MNDSLSNVVDNLSELYVCKCLNKEEQDIKIKYKQQNNIKIVCTKCKSCNTKKTIFRFINKKISMYI